LCDQRAQARVPSLHQPGDVDPQRVILHFHRLIEREGLGPQVKPEPAKGLRITIEELRRMAPHHTIKRGHALLAVEQQFDNSSGKRSIAPVRRRFRFGSPNQQPAYRVAAIKRVK
jgi:hypothetical protein